MSELLRELASAVKSASDPAIRTLAGKVITEEQPGLAAAEPTRASARVVEGTGGVDPVDVGRPETGLFTHFMDGMQRVHTPLTYGYIPIVYGYVAAAIRMRGQNRYMSTYKHASSEALYCPMSYADPKWLQGRIKVIDTSDVAQPSNDNLMAFINCAHKKVGQVRENLEAELVNGWYESFSGADNWMLVDGSLAGKYDQYENPNVVGIIKSHQTQYFSVEEQTRIVSMPAGSRSKVFIPMGRNRAAVYSWYVRLRPNDGMDAYFGLVRVEAPAIDRTLEMADTITRWLLAERAPLSLPDARWDRLVYPIHDCEMYMKSKAPSWTLLQSIMAGSSRIG